MNLQVSFTGCCITSLDLPQHRTYKGELNISKRSTEIRPHQTLLQTAHLQQALFLQHMAKRDWHGSSDGQLALPGTFRVGQIIAQVSSLECKVAQRPRVMVSQINLGLKCRFSISSLPVSMLSNPTIKLTPPTLCVYLALFSPLKDQDTRQRITIYRTCWDRASPFSKACRTLPTSHLLILVN